MANRETVREQLTSVAELFDVYLEWCSTRRSLGTYRNSKLYLRSFIDCIGTRLPIAKLKPLHISNWMDAHSDWTDTTWNDAISIVQRPLNWGVRQVRLDRRRVDVRDLSDPLAGQAQDHHELRRRRGHAG